MDERRESLAEQAAAWVPPWERERSQPAPDSAATGSAEPAQTEPEAEADSGPEASAEAVSEAPVDAVAGGAEVGDSGVVSDGGESGVAGGLGSGEVGEPVEVESGGSRVAVDVDVSGEAVEVESGESGAVVDVDVSGEAAEPESGESGAVADVDVSGEAAEPGSGAEADRIGDAQLRAALEAILLVVDEPVSDGMLAQVLQQPTERVTGALAALAADYTSAGRGFDLRRAAGGWRLYTRGEYAAYVERFILDGQQIRLTQAALETLAVVAYKQPVTRSRISAIRGVNCDGVIRTLVNRGLIEECGSEPESGAYLYRTTAFFLEKLGLDSVAELPPLAPFLPDDVEEIADAQH